MALVFWWVPEHGGNVELLEFGLHRVQVALAHVQRGVLREALRPLEALDFGLRLDLRCAKRRAMTFETAFQSTRK